MDAIPLDEKEIIKIINNLPKARRDCLILTMQHMPREGDELMILKGHLIAEVMIWQLIDMFTKQRLAEDANLTFYHRLCLAEALFPGKEPGWVWTALKKLNSIRNKYAHALSPKGIEDKIKDFISFVDLHHNIELPPEAPPEETETIRWRIELVNLELSKLVSSIKKVHVEVNG